MSIELNTRIKCSECPIRHRAVCSKADDDELSRMEAMKYYRTYEAGQRILWGGDQMDYVASVVSGVASISKTMEDGRTQILGLLLPSDFVGRPGRSEAPFDVTSETEVTLCCFRRKPFEQLVEEVPHVNQRLLELVMDELDAAREWLVLLGRKTAREKVSTFLMMLEKRTHVPDVGNTPQAFDMPLTREEIADYLGLTVETVSRQITGLRKDGIIQLGGAREVKILDIDRLRDAAGEDALI